MIAFDVRVYRFVFELKDLGLKSVPQIKDNIISVGLNCECKEIDFKLDACRSQELQRESKLARHDEDLNRLSRLHERLVCLQKLDDMAVRKDNLSFMVAIWVFLLSFVRDQHRDKVNQLDLRLLIEIHLSPFNFDQLVANVFVNLQHDLVLQHVMNNLVVLGNQ